MRNLLRIFAALLAVACSTLEVKTSNPGQVFLISMPGQSWHEALKNVPLDGGTVLLIELRHAGHGGRISLFEGRFSDKGQLYSIVFWTDRFLRSLRPGYRFPSVFRRDDRDSRHESFAFECIRYGQRWSGKAIAFRNPLRPNASLIAEAEAMPQHLDETLNALDKVIGDMEANARLQNMGCGDGAKNWPACRERR